VGSEDSPPRPCSAHVPFPPRSEAGPTRPILWRGSLETAVLFARLARLVATRYLGKPDLGEFLAIRFPDLRSLAVGARNELAFRLGAHAAARLTTLNIELTSRCNVACSYCTVNRELGRPHVDMDVDLAARLIEQTPGLQTLLPFQWGEPLMYEPLDEVLSLAHRRGVRTYLTTNGLALDGDRFRRLAAAGLTRLTVSLDGSEQEHDRRRGYAQAPVLERLAEVRRAQQTEGLATALDVSMVVDDEVADGLDEFRARVGPLVDRVQLIPRMIARERQRACREPSRGVLVVLADGRVTTCCADPRGELALGHVRDASPPEIYSAAAFLDLRRRQRAKDFPETCRNCGECDVPGVSKRFT
jgi:MoaA/NifB/PqqE/SkfB family radical SAM enzyme